MLRGRSGGQMAGNIEIKARISSVAAVEPNVAALAAQGPIEIHQEDIFFRCEAGRLKLRITSDSTGELIFYRRADTPGPKESFYVRAPTANPTTLCQVLSLAHGEIGRVVKLRTLYLLGRTRIHLDRVENLGDFLELEVVLEEDEPRQRAISEAHALMERLGIEADALIEVAY